jgi:hypothetical protein
VYRLQGLVSSSSLARLPDPRTLGPTEGDVEGDSTDNPGRSGWFIDHDHHGGNRDGRPAGVPIVCWVCDQVVHNMGIDFEGDGPHARCAAKAQRIDNGFRRQRRQIPAAFGGPPNWLGVQW